MLRGGGHISSDCSVATLDVKLLDLQGVLSQTFKLVVTYSGTPESGMPTEFIAKFINPDPAFAWVAKTFICLKHNRAFRSDQIVWN